jgi:hypothetical protein
MSVLVCLFTQRERHAVLPGIGRELVHDHRRCDRPRFNRHGEAQQFEPMIADDAKIEGARHQRGELGRECAAQKRNPSSRHMAKTCVADL